MFRDGKAETSLTLLAASICVATPCSVKRPCLDVTGSRITCMVEVVHGISQVGLAVS